MPCRLVDQWYGSGLLEVHAVREDMGILCRHGHVLGISAVDRNTNTPAVPAELVLARNAVAALPARQRVVDHHPVPDPQSLHPTPELRHFSCKVAAQHVRKLVDDDAVPPGSCESVQMVQGRGPHPNNYLPGRWRGIGQVTVGENFRRTLLFDVSGFHGMSTFRECMWDAEGRESGAVRPDYSTGLDPHLPGKFLQSALDGLPTG